jgi:hypothetical protein
MSRVGVPCVGRCPQFRIIRVEMFCQHFVVQVINTKSGLFGTLMYPFQQFLFGVPMVMSFTTDIDAFDFTNIEILVARLNERRPSL